MSSARFQLWRLVSQSGSYQIQERTEKQVFEMTCTASRVCRRVTTTEGGGEIPAPAGGRSIGGASMFEVDGLNKDIVLMLPVALSPLETKTTIESTIPNDKSTGGKTFAKPIGMNAKPITVKIPGGRVSASGTQTIKIDGEGVDGGTLTINWSLAAK
jgi:hypothetical protein